MNITLNQIAKIRAGHAFRGSVKPIDEGTVRVIQPRDQVADGSIDWLNLVRTEVTGKKQPEWLKAGDIVFLARGSSNVASLLEQVPHNTLCSPYFYVIEVRDHSQILPSFLAWQLNQTAAKRYFQTSGEGSLQLSIRRKILEEAPISLPPKAQQQKIMQLVQCAERERHAYLRLIELRQQQIAAVAQDLINN